MKLSTRTCSARLRGFTLVEMMVGIGVGSLVILTFCVAFLSSTFSFAAVGNYLDLDQKSERALDLMTRDIRRSANLVSFATNQVVFNFAGTTNLVYAYDSSSRKLTSWKTGDAGTNILLTGCDYLQFSMYGGVPQPGGILTNTTSVAQAKALSVTWRCYRTILGQKKNTETTREAVIVIRNKPVS